MSSITTGATKAPINLEMFEVLEENFGRAHSDQAYQTLESYGLHDYEKPLGSGVRGSVHQIKGHGMFEGKKLALKLFEIPFDFDENYGEGVTLKLPKGKHLGRAYGLIVKDSKGFRFIQKAKEANGTKIYGVVSRAQGTSLLKKIYFGPPLSLDAVRGYGKPLAEAVHALHIKGIVHSDLKPDNVVAKPKQTGKAPYRIKLIDFGVSFPKGGKETIGDPEYTPTENHYSQRGDWFSYGKTLYELATAHFAYRTVKWDHEIGGEYSAFDFKKDKFPDEDLKDLLFNPKKGLLNDDPKKRAQGKEVLSHPFFTGATTSRVTSK